MRNRKLDSPLAPIQVLRYLVRLHWYIFGTLHVIIIDVQLVVPDSKLCYATIQLKTHTQREVKECLEWSECEKLVRDK